MRLNLNEPVSIAEWFKVNPAHHGQFLRWALRNWPQFKDAIVASRELVK